jgi:hypothetical protein
MHAVAHPPTCGVAAGGTGDGPALPAFARTVVPRHGARPLGFEGRLLLRASCQPPALPVWSELAVHETAAGALVGTVRHCPRGPDGAPEGPPFSYAATCDDPGELLDWLHSHDPLADLPSFLLAGPAFDGGPARPASAALRDAWRALLDATFGPGSDRASSTLHGDPGATP